jgi:hypothetical protein
MPTCFVIMPLTTPESLVPLYGKDADHFSHLLDHLFVPAVKDAGFEPIPPMARGADVIQAEIVRNLESADLVLCDISTLNANVFFELGCRTALNRPVCYVMDDLTRAIPFDTGIINHHVYSHTLAPWTLSAEIERLSAHIRLSAERSSGKNMLWQYFGLKSAAHAVKSEGDEKDRLGYIVMQVDAIKKRLEAQSYVYSDAPFTNQLTALSNLAFSTAADNSMYNVPMFASGVNLLPRDWNNEIAESEKVLQQIMSLQKPDERRPDIDSVRKLIEQHIKSLDELIDAEPESKRAEKARFLQVQFRALLSRRTI